MLNGLSLFSGVGGIEIGLSDWVKTKAYCDIDKYACAVLRSRMSEGLLDKGEIYGDIKELHFKEGEFDIITGGFPCVDISNAGKRKGITAERSGLWFEMARLISEIRPRFVFVENVSAIINRGLDRVLGSLSEIGYDAIWTTLRASDVGAPHRRERFFLLGYPQHIRWDKTKNSGEHSEKESKVQTRTELCNLQSAGTSSLRKDTIEGVGEEDVPHPNIERLQRSLRKELQESTANREFTRQDLPNWTKDPAEFSTTSKSYVGRVVDGIPNRVDRIKCLGNAVVPKQAKEAFKILITSLSTTKTKNG